MSLEKHFPTFTNSKEQNPKKPEGIKSLGKKAFPYIAALTTFFGIANSGNAQTEKESKNKTKIEYVVKSPDGSKDTTFSSQEEMDNFLKSKKLNKKDTLINSKQTAQDFNYNLKEAGMSDILNNKKASLENNVFNSAENFLELINKNGKTNYFYFPHQVGKASPYWAEKKGEVIINNLDDYKKHIETNLVPNGFKGSNSASIEHFGFHLEKNEFITDLKYDVMVKARVIGGEGYVLLKKGTGVIMEKAFDKNGKPCNKIVYILACVNPVLANDPFTNPDGSGGFRL